MSALLFMVGMFALALSSSRACRSAAVCVTGAVILHLGGRDKNIWLGFLIATVPVLLVAVYRSLGSTITEQDLNVAD